ncbi:MAG: hypothetical protein DHS20C07_10270 [Methyloligella sp.]|nr:MAG: hypothetical protein DHS20C07_10270 [Methyloligella sp.]
MNKKTAKIINLCLTFIFTAILTEMSLNQAQAEENIPNLIGTWDGGNKTISEKKGYKTRNKTIHITEQKDRRFKGHVTYSGRKFNFLGVIYPDNQSFTWVSKGSRGYNHGRILSKEKIAACYVEAGIDATAGCATLKKAK